MMNKEYPWEKILKGYHLIAVDGADLIISYDRGDKNTYHKIGLDSRDCNLYHINAAYDILCSRSIDMVIHSKKHESEQAALITMAERYPYNKSIWITDSNYHNWNIMEHIMCSGKHFLFRSKDIHS